MHLIPALLCTASQCRAPTASQSLPTGVSFRSVPCRQRAPRFRLPLPSPGNRTVRSVGLHPGKNDAGGMRSPTEALAHGANEPTILRPYPLARRRPDVRPACTAGYGAGHGVGDVLEPGYEHWGTEDNSTDASRLRSSAGK